MALTTIATQKTPARPTQVTLAAQGGLPNAVQSLVLIGAMGATGGAGSGSQLPYTQVVINNVGDVAAATSEANTKFGAGTQLAKMVIAAVKANAAGPNFPPISCVPLPSGATNFGGGSNNLALNVLDKMQADFVASPFDGSTDAVNRAALVTEAQAMSGATRTSNSQYGTTAVVANTTVTDPSTLPKPDTQNLVACWLRDTSGNPYSVAELAAACAAVLAANPVPFNPLDYVAIPGVTAPVSANDWISVGGGLESETCLNAGWVPLCVRPNGQVAFVRTVCTRWSVGDGVTAATAYIDVQDFQVLYYFRKAVATRFSQPDFANTKNSPNTAKSAKGEIIRLMQAFEDESMFEGVSQLAQQVVVQTNVSDVYRLDCYIPVDVVPGLHVIASNVQAGTQFDFFTI